MAAIAEGSVAGEQQQPPPPFAVVVAEDDKYSKALVAAMEEARLSLCCTAVVVHGDKTLVEKVYATLLDSKQVFDAMAAKRPFSPLPDPEVYKEVAGVVLVFADLEAQCKANYVTADGLLSAIRGLHKATGIFIGAEAAAALRPYRPTPSSPFPTQEEKANYVCDLASDFAVLVADAKGRLAVAVPSMPNSSILKPRHFILVEGDEYLLKHITATCKESQGLLVRMIGKANKGPFPLTDLAFKELVGITHPISILQAQCTQGFATADAVVAGMEALKSVTVFFAGTRLAAPLRPHSPWPSSPLSSPKEELSYMWDLAASFSILFYDVKFRFRDLHSSLITDSEAV